MSTLILPTNEPTTGELLVPSRRSFIRGTALTLAGLFVAPSIVRAENLMHINTPANRLVWAFMDKLEFRVSQGKGAWVESGINASAAWKDDFLEIWKRHNSVLHYELKRYAEINVLRAPYEKRRIFNNHLDLHCFQDKGFETLWIPDPKRAELITCDGKVIITPEVASRILAD